MAERRQDLNALKIMPQVDSILFIDGVSKRKKQFSDLASLIVKPSTALERMKLFLPQMAAANSDMDTELSLNPASYNVEEVDDVEGPIIEMNIALVDFGANDEEQEEEESSDVDSGASVDDSSTDSDSDLDDQSQKPSQIEKNFRLKLEARRRKPLLHPVIEVLGGDDTVSSPENLGECSASDDPVSLPGIQECGSSDEDSARSSISARESGDMQDSV